ncbi:MAG: hypothetical protein GJ676_04080 [Rhodobacteraceae bacterium]|nr:hypothetical protein [Paracoccaceae bacterium]
MANVSGNSRDNILNGTQTNDTIRGFGGTDTLNGNGGNDRLFGGSGQDILNGGEGNDRFFLRASETITTETYSGGTGFDRLIINGSANFNNLLLDDTASVEQVDMKNGFFNGTNGADVINLSGVRKFTGFINVINLLDGNDTFFGSKADDRVSGGKGDDKLYGGIGDDKLRGGQGTDSYFGGRGDDQFLLTNGETSHAEVFNGGLGTDTLEIDGAAYFSKLTLKQVNSVETIDFGNGFFRGTTGRDIIDITGVSKFENFRNIIDLDAGNDLFRGSALNDRVTGGAGADQIHGNGGDDKIRGGQGTDRLFGGAGDDEFILVNGEIIRGEKYDGGTGYDSLKIDGSAKFNDLELTSAKSVEEIDFGFGFFSGTKRDDTVDISGVSKLKSFTNAINLGAGNDTFRGSSANDRVHGGKGNDVLYGNEGRDRLTGGQGRDSYFGGAGDDEFHLLNGETVDGEVFDGGAGNDILQINGSANFKSLDLSASTSVEEIDFGSGFFKGTNGSDNIDISGVSKFTLFSNAINLGAGDDTFRGSSVNDRVHGGKGNDVLFGNDGRDKLTGGHGRDSYFGGADDDEFHLLNGETVNNEVFDGGTGNDSLEINGVAHFKSLDLSASTSVEEINFGSGFFKGTDGDDTIDISGVTTFTLFSNAITLEDGDDTFQGAVTNDRVQGGDGEDELFGNAGRDRLQGGNDDDILDGGADDDRLIGGNGTDTFIYNSGADRIEDFDGDRLHLDASLWTGTLTVSQVLAFASVVRGDTVFNFGNGNTLTLDDYRDIAGLADDLTII